MGRTFVSRFALCAVALGIALMSATAPAPAALQMSTGLRHIEHGASIDDCNAKAKAALDANLQNAFETAPNSGMWLAYGPPDAAGNPTAAAAIHCYPVDKDYVVTFTCAVDQPPNPFGAGDLCVKLNAGFQGKTAAALATPTPLPTGCATTNLVGTWTADDKNGAIFKFDANGGLVDNENVSGNWALNGMTASIVYYGTNSATLSADGKHLNGKNANYTRKC